MSARRGSARGKPAPQLEQVVVSLNLGGRNLNPLEFVLAGDDSQVRTRLNNIADAREKKRKNNIE